MKRLIQVTGMILLGSGVLAAFIGPLEIYTFYAFIDGGRFHFDGFGFGSLMFGIIAIQVGGYYLIAALGIFLGYGHLKFKQWSRKITLALLWSWIILGFPLTIVAFLVLLSFSDLSQGALPFLGFIFVLVYPVLPFALIRLYSSKQMVSIFDDNDPDGSWLGQTPLSILILGTLMCLIALGLFIPMLFNGIFPVFGKFMFGLEGIILLDLSILGLVFLSWGWFRRQVWAWWGSLVFFLLMTGSTILTLINFVPIEVVSEMQFAPIEREIVETVLQNAPLKNIHFVLLFGGPLLITTSLIGIWRRNIVGPISVIKE